MYVCIEIRIRINHRRTADRANDAKGCLGTRMPREACVSATAQPVVSRRDTLATLARVLIMYVVNGGQQSGRLRLPFTVNVDRTLCWMSPDLRTIVFVGLGSVQISCLTCSEAASLHRVRVAHARCPAARRPVRPFAASELSVLTSTGQPPSAEFRQSPARASVPTSRALCMVTSLPKGRKAFVVSRTSPSLPLFSASKCLKSIRSRRCFDKDVMRR